MSGADQKEGVWVLQRMDDVIRRFLVPKVPLWMETYHLTMMTLIWSFVIIVSGFLARYNVHWLWVTSAMIALQYVTDLLDGAIGRSRNSGFIKWGFYMDHLLDYLFLSSIIIGYSLLLPDQFKYVLFFVQTILGGFMVSSFLSFGATGKFNISYSGIGPTEVRLFFIGINCILIFFGIDLLSKSMPLFLIISVFIFFLVVWRSHRDLWKLDMLNHKKKN